jgi:hypothetical protein
MATLSLCNHIGTGGMGEQIDAPAISVDDHMMKHS